MHLVCVLVVILMIAIQYISSVSQSTFTKCLLLNKNISPFHYFTSNLNKLHLLSQRSIGVGQCLDQASFGCPNYVNMIMWTGKSFGFLNDRAIVCDHSGNIVELISMKLHQENSEIQGCNFLTQLNVIVRFQSSVPI